MLACCETLVVAGLRNDWGFPCFVQGVSRTRASRNGRHQRGLDMDRREGQVVENEGRL